MEENTHRKNAGWETLPSSSVKLRKLPVVSMADAEPAAQLEALFTSPVFLSPRDVGICGDLVFTQYSHIPSNTLLQKYFTMMESFYSSQKYTRVEGICRDILGLSP
jgi:hypothetical protein